MSATFLVTAFEPFGEHRTNSSWDALEATSVSWPSEIATLLLPVDYRAAHTQLRQAIDDLNPRAVLCTGLAKGLVFRVERQARRPVALADEVGAARAGGRWPWAEMRQALGQAGVVTLDSNDAGRYVCESTYWSLLTYGTALRRPEFAAFLHVPPESQDHPIPRIAKAVGSVVQARAAALGVHF